MTRILVTGGAGFIGSHAVLELLDGGYEVVVLDDLRTGFRSAVDSRARLVEGSVADSGLVAGLLSETKFDAILHFAGSLVVPESIENPRLYYFNNTIASASLIANAIEVGITRFIFSSTAAVYGEPVSAKVPESHPAVPINPYGWSKLMTEQMLRDMSKASALNYVILRYFNVAGADPAGRAGQMTEGATHLIKVAIEALLERRSHVEIFGGDFPTRDGTGVRDYIHVSDLANAHKAALEYLLRPGAVSHTLNCGYGTGYSVRDVLDTLERVSGRAVPWRLSGRRTGDPAEIVADNKAITRLLGWQPRYAKLETILRHALDWELALRDKVSNAS